MRLTYGGAIREAIFAELSADQNVVMLGQDIQHNIYGYTGGLLNSFGERRIINTPLSEAAVVGAAIGASMRGLRPIVDLTVTNFLYVAMDQIVNMASKISYMYDGQFNVPITIMCSAMYNSNSSSQHSDRPHSMFMSVPGLKIVAPATPQAAYSLLRASVNDNNPVLFFSDRSLFYNESDVDLDLDMTIGAANIVQSGNDLTIVSISGGLSIVNAVMPDLTECDISVDHIDMSSLSPLDIDAVVRSIKKTGRLIIVDTANKTCSAASEISSIIAEDHFYLLKAPIGIVAYDDVPIPFSSKLERALMPTPEKLLNKVKRVMGNGS